MEDRRPSSVGPAGVGARPPCAALAEDRRGERQGNGPALTGSGGEQEDVPEAPGRGPRWFWRGVRCGSVDSCKWRRNRGLVWPAGGVWRLPVLLARRCPAWRRREPGLRLLHGT